MRILKILFVSVVVFSSFKANAQFSSSYYTSISFSKIGVGYEFTNRLWVDLRIYGGHTFYDFTVEPVIAFNYTTKDWYDLYIGAGYTINFFNGPILPIGLRIKPLERHRNIKINLEAEPAFSLYSREPLFFCSVGIGYVFGNKN